MTRVDIADYLGLTIETVSRTLMRLCAEEMIDIVAQSGLVITDRFGLENVAGGLACDDHRARTFSQQRQSHPHRCGKHVHATL